MSSKHIPIRKCMGCCKRRAKEEFIRTVSEGEGKTKELLIDKTYKKDGRGIYVCKEEECLKKARKARRLERTFSCKVSDEFYDELERMILEVE